MKHFLFTLILIACSVCPCAIIRGQVTDDVTPLYEREPFDRIKLDQVNDGAIVDVFPIKDIKNGLPPSFEETNYIIRRLQDPADILYSVNGKHVVRIQRYQDLLLLETRRALKRQDVDEAFLLLSRLQQVAPNTPGIQKLEEDFYFADTRELFRKKLFDEALLSIERVLKLNPNRAGLNRVLNTILSQTINTEFAAGDYRSVRAKLIFARRKYGTLTQPLVDKWNGAIKSKGEEQFTIAKKAFAADDTSTALMAIRKASDIWPELDGVEELKSTILAKFSDVRVGVTQEFHPTEKSYSPADMLNWATRRTGRLLQRDLLALDNYSVDGAIYRSEFGKLGASDLRKIELTLSADYIQNGHRLTQQMLALADPNSHHFSPRWSEYVKEIYLNSPKIEIQLTRPTLRPEGLLPRVLRDSSIADLTKGNFERAPSSAAGSQAFVQADGQAANSFNELREILYSDASEAASAIDAGLVDIVDRINPGDFDRLLRVPDVSLIPYRLPTIHGLVFNDRQDVLRDATFRRGLLYGIDRQTFVNEELGSREKEIATVLSGFAPIGRSKNDPLGYAYSRQITPRPYDPSLGSVLLKLALRSQQIREAAKKRSKANNLLEEAAARVAEKEKQSEQGKVAKEEEPELPELVLAFPENSIAGAACVSISANWQRLGVRVKLRPMPAGRVIPSDSNWDVLYVESMIEEPLVDLPELVLGHQILGRHGGLVWQAMRQLQESDSIEDTRSEFMRIHQLIYDHTPILPLWQIIEHIAVRKSVTGISESPISLYDDIDQWRMRR